ncbi:hypothetical protein GGD83_003852 [Rhodoblastus sphagnicola]|nr:hypothetical protein [Rhodoblastus sphagnicola]
MGAVVLGVTQGGLSPTVVASNTPAAEKFASRTFGSGLRHRGRRIEVGLLRRAPVKR